MANRLIRHTKLFRILTIAGASLGVISSSTFAVFLGVNANGDHFLTDEVRQYTARFSSEGSLISETTYQRGDEIVIPEAPAHSIDGENNYLFVGWDVTGNGLPDLVMPRIYYSFNANAVFMPVGKFDLSFLDLSKMDPETLMKLLENLNLDWEQFMDVFNISQEDLMKWLQNNPVLKFTADDSRYIAYFRSTSYGDYDYKAKKLSNPSFYDSSKISPGSINPLSYTADKVNQAYSMTGTLPSEFDFVNFDIEFATKQNYYPVPDCEIPSHDDAMVDSDAHYLKTPINNQYHTRAAYVPAFNEVIDILRLVPNYSNAAIDKDQRAYYKYALENYTNIPKEYEEVIDGIIKENDWYEQDYGQVNSIGAYVERLGSLNMFNEQGQITLGGQKNKDPVNGLIENRSGSDLDFNLTAMMIFRRLNIPARIVKGYLPTDGIKPGINYIYFFSQHYWCEIYVKNVGWMICDCMNMEQLLGTNPYGELDRQSNPIVDEKELDHIIVNPPHKTEYYIGETLEVAGASITAYYTDDSNKDISIYNKDVNVDISGFDPFTVGEYEITVSYTEEGITKSDSFVVKIVEPPAKFDHFVFNFDNVKKDYFVGEEFDATGIVVNAYYEDGTVVDVSDTVKTSGYFDMNTIGSYEVYVSATAYDPSINENVTGNDMYLIHVNPNNVVSIEVTSLPNKTTYYVDELFQSTGMVITATNDDGSQIDLKPSSVSFDVERFVTPDENQVVNVYYFNTDGSMVTTSFTVTVKPNPPASIDAEEVGGTYTGNFTVGDTFDPNAFIGDGDFKITYENGVTTEITDTSLLDFEVPDFSTPGSNSIKVSYTEGDTTVSTNVPITISEVDPVSFSVSSKVSTAGPGDLPSRSVFNFTTEKLGTIYFRNASYSTYDPIAGWTNSQSITNYTVSPNSFTYNKVSQLYNTHHVEISYVQSLKYGLSPSYSDVGGGDEYATSETKESGSTDSYNTSIFNIGEGDDCLYDYRRLTNSEYGIKYDDNVATVANSYSPTSIRNSAGTTVYLDVSCSENAITEIEKFVADHGLSAVDANDVEQRIKTMNEVKSILQSEFTYDISFKYANPSADPIYSFLVNKVGICNNFNSTATMILRYLNIPTRYVVGYGAMSNGGVTNVSSDRAHAWCEVYLDNLGWVILDATGYDDGHKRGDKYGDGFSENTMYNEEKIVYGGDIHVEYNRDEFNPEYDDVYGNGYWLTYDGEKHGEKADWSFVVGGVKLPDYLKIELVFETDTDATSVGRHVLVPKIKVTDKITGEVVNEQYGFNLEEGTANNEFTVVPAMIFINISAGSDTYTLSNGSTLTLSFENGNLLFSIDQASDAMASSDNITVSGTVSFDTPGNYSLYSENIIIYLNGINIDDPSFTSNYVIIPIYGEIIINPPEGVTP